MIATTHPNGRSHKEYLCPERCCPHQGNIEISFTFHQGEREFIAIPFSSPRVQKVYHCISEVFVQQVRIKIPQTNEISRPKVVVQEKMVRTCKPRMSSRRPCRINSKIRLKTSRDLGAHASDRRRQKHTCKQQISFRATVPEKTL